MNKQQEAREQFNAACEALKAAGINVVACLSSYETRKSVHFSTRISVQANDELGVSEDHVVLDSLREITNNWSDIVHPPDAPHVD